MFCIQCEQTIRAAHLVGCAYKQGMCGKTAEVSDLQDVLITCLQGLSFWCVLGRQYQIIDSQIDRWSPRAFFSTLTNVNFDPQRIMQYISITQSYQEKLSSAVKEAAAKAKQQLPPLSYAVGLNLPILKGELSNIATYTMVNRGKEHLNEDIIGLRLLCLYGLKGAAAYMEHAAVLGQTDDGVYAQYHHIMAYLGNDPTCIDDLFATAMQIGSLNYTIMEMLDRGETQAFGHPIPTEVNISPVQGKCILVSGHDLEDLYMILEQTKGLGINVYTHGEMLPAHSYPELKKYPHLVGNYGSAWQNQQKEFAQFPGAIVMTSNCIINPNVGQYRDRIFTRNIVGWPDVEHIKTDDFSVVIEKALSLTGFMQTQPEHMITVGFGRNALMNVAPAVIEQIKAGNISHFFLVGGCDGGKEERHYYADFVSKVPQDSVILTLACGKYRFNKNEYGDINGIPRLLDIGQCNDTYSAIQLALALSKEFNCHINDLPLTLVLSWFEQKAIVVLLTLLSLGVKGIYIGPTFPAFLTENLIASLQQQFDLRLIDDPKQDLDTMLKDEAA